MSEENTPFGVTLKGQGQNDPWTTIRGSTVSELRDGLLEFLPPEIPEDDAQTMATPELVAQAAAEYVRVLNAQPGISAQRDRAATASSSAQEPPAGGVQQETRGARPPLSRSPETDGNYWINIPYNRDTARAARWRDTAKALGARYKPDDCPASVQRNSKGSPERPWCVHTRYVSEENVAELLRLNDEKFDSIK